MKNDAVKKCVYLIFGAGILAGILGCGGESGKRERPPLAVNVEVIKTQDVPLQFSYPARLKSIQQSSVYARVEGVLLAQHVKEGGIVKKDERLFTIDPTRYQAKVNMARAQYDSALANFTKAKKDYERVTKLYKDGVYTIDQYDTSTYNYQSAKANVANAKAALDDALIDLGYTNVTATSTGRVGIRKYDVGNVVGRSGQDELTTITQLSPIYAEFAIPSSDFYYMKNLDTSGISVTFVLNNGAKYEQSGKIDFVDSVLDAQTSSVKARAIVDNEKYALMPNDFVRVQLDGLIAKDAIAIPQSALMQDAQGSYVYVAKDNKASIARVSLGHNLKSPEVIVLSGLKAGDKLITTQLAKLEANAPITEANLDSSAKGAKNAESKEGVESNGTESKKDKGHTLDSRESNVATNNASDARENLNEQNLNNQSPQSQLNNHSSAQNLNDKLMAKEENKSV